MFYILTLTTSDGTRQVQAFGSSQKYSSIKEFQKNYPVEDGVTANYYAIPNNVSLPLFIGGGDTVGNTANGVGVIGTGPDGVTYRYGESLNATGSTASFLSGSPSQRSNTLNEPQGNNRFNYRDTTKDKGAISNLVRQDLERSTYGIDFNNILIESDDTASPEFYALDPKNLPDLAVATLESILKQEADDNFILDLDDSKTITFKRDDGTSTSAAFKTDLDTQLEINIILEYSNLNQELVASSQLDSVSQTKLSVVDETGEAYSLSPDEFKRFAYEYFRKLYESHVPRVNMINTVSTGTNTIGSLLSLSYQGTKSNPSANSPASFSGPGSGGK